MPMGVARLAAVAAVLAVGAAQAPADRRKVGVKIATSSITKNWNQKQLQGTNDYVKDKVVRLDGEKSFGVKGQQGQIKKQQREENNKEYKYTPMVLTEKGVGKGAAQQKVQTYTTSMKFSDGEKKGSKQMMGYNAVKAIAAVMAGNPEKEGPAGDDSVESDRSDGRDGDSGPGEVDSGDYGRDFSDDGKFDGKLGGSDDSSGKGGGKFDGKLGGSDDSSGKGGGKFGGSDDSADDIGDILEDKNFVRGVISSIDEAIGSEGKPNAKARELIKYVTKAMTESYHLGTGMSWEDVRSCLTDYGEETFGVTHEQITDMFQGGTTALKQTNEEETAIHVIKAVHADIKQCSCMGGWWTIGADNKIQLVRGAYSLMKESYQETDQLFGNDWVRAVGDLWAHIHGGAYEYMGQQHASRFPSCKKDDFMSRVEGMYTDVFALYGSEGEVPDNVKYAVKAVKALVTKMKEPPKSDQEKREYALSTTENTYALSCRVMISMEDADGDDDENACGSRDGSSNSRDGKDPELSSDLELLDLLPPGINDEDERGAESSEEDFKLQDLVPVV